MALIRFYKNWYMNDEIDQESNISAFFYCNNSAAGATFPGISEAKMAGGCFVGIIFENEATKFQELDEIGEQIESKSTEIALIFFVGTRREYSIYRDGWRQARNQDELFISHLDLRIMALGGGVGGPIEPSRRNSKRRLNLGKFNFKLLGGGLQVSDFEFDMYDGSLSSSFKMNTGSLKKNNGIPFLTPRSISRRRINYSKILNSIVEPSDYRTLDVFLKIEPVTNHWFPSKLGNLDLASQNSGDFPKFRKSVQHNFSRNRLLITDSRELPLTSKDTIGRVLSIAGSSAPIEFGFYSFPDRARLKQESPNKLGSADLNVALAPVGKWQIKPSGQKIEKRLKLGLSNTETVNIMEGEGVYLGLEFPSDYDDFGPAFIYEPLKRSPEVATKQFKNLSPITNWLRAPHPKFVLMDEFNRKFSLSDQIDLRFSSQPSNLVRYRGGGSRKTMSDSVPFQPEFLSDLSSEILESFIPQLNVNSLTKFPNVRNFNYQPRDLDEFMAVTRSNELRKFLTTKKKKIRTTEFKHEAITPQSFILKEERTASGQSLTFVLAQSEDKNETLELFVNGDSELALDLKRPNFLIVLPSIEKESSGEYPYEIRAKFNIDDWTFQFSLKDTDNKNRSRQPLTILKYQKGVLLEKVGDKYEGMLVDAQTWANQPNKADIIVRQIKEWADLAKFDAPEYEYLVSQVLKNPDWTGVLFINPALNIGDLPPAIRGAAAGSDLEQLTGHHVGFSLNKTKIVDDTPIIEGSSFFGMVDYKDDTPLNSDKVYDFKLKQLRVGFANSEVRTFKAKLDVKIPKLLDEDLNKKIIEIDGNWEKITDENGEKIGDRYSFELNTDWVLLDSKKESDLIQKITLRRIEYISDENVEKSDTTNGDGIWINSHLLIDADFKFGSVGDLDVFSFDNIGFEGLRISFKSELIYNGSKWIKGRLPRIDLKIDFGNLKVLTDLRRLRDGFMKGFPLKFRKFHIYLGKISLPDIGFYELEGKGKKFKFGFEFDVDFGRLAKLIGFDGDFIGRMMLGWFKNENGDWDWTFGYKFPGNGGDSLDLDLGFIRLTADHFDMFDVDDVYTMVANNGAIHIGDYRLPPEDSELGFVISPNKQNPTSAPTSWMISFGQTDFLFLDEFFVVMGQGISLESPKPTVKDNVDNIIKLANTKIEGEQRKEKAGAFRKEFDKSFGISPSAEWFAGMRASMLGNKSNPKNKLFEANVIYDPPNYFGGSVDVSNLFFIEISYKQLTPEVGLYSGSLKIHENLASLDFGAVRVQIPKITVQLDTAGGWAINIGLNETDPTDFSDAIAIEITIFKGDAGIYFGRLHGSAFSEVPMVKTTAGSAVIAYNPVTKVIFAFRVGLGREFKKSILTAGASITFYGVLSGVYGKLNYSGTEELVKDVPKKYYKFYGEAGVLAEIYGVIDFKVTRFRLHARLQVGYGIIFQTETPTTIYAKGIISVRLRWVIGRIKIFGKKIEIKITLSFKASIYWEFELDNNGSWDDYYVSRQSSKSLPKKNHINFDSKKIEVGAIQFNNSIVPAKLSSPTSLDLYADIDTTLNDDGNPILIPQLIIPFEKNKDGNWIPGNDFQTLVNFVLRWSLQCMDLWDPNGAKSFKLNSRQLLKIDDIIGEIFLKPIDGRLVRMTDPERGEWIAPNLMKHLKANFDINIEALSDSFPAEQEATKFVGDFHYDVLKEDGSSLGRFGDGVASENLVEILDEHFEHLRMAFEDKYYNDNTRSLKSQSKKFLSSFLFEEYFEAILKSVWAELASLAHEENPENYDNSKVEFSTDGFLKKIPVGFSFSRISSMVNSFASSGARINDGQNKTILDHENAVILLDDVLTSSGKLDVIFEWSDRSHAYPVKFERNSDEKLEDYPSAKEINNFITADIDKLPLKFVSDIFTIHSGIQVFSDNEYKERIFELPKAFVRKYSEIGPTEYALTVPRPLYESQKDKNTPLSGVTSRSSCIIRLPIRVNSFQSNVDDLTHVSVELARANESDRRQLALLTNALSEEDYRDCQVRCLIPGYGTDDSSKMVTALHEMKEPWIARSNLSEDENPTSFSKMAKLTTGNLAINHSETVKKQKGFLDLVFDAIHTNSGGYVISAKLNKNDIASELAKESREIWLIIDFPEIPFISGISHVSSKNIESETYNLYPMNADGFQSKRLEAPRDPGVLDLIVNRTNSSANKSNAFKFSDRFRMLEIGLENIKGVNGVQFTTTGSMDSIDDLPTPPQDWINETDSSQLDGSGEEYLWSMPIYRRLKPNPTIDFDPPSENRFKVDAFIYGAVGSTIEVEYGFRDVLGFRPLSPYQQRNKIEMGYTDPIITPIKLPFTTISGAFSRKARHGLVYNIDIELKKPSKEAIGNYKVELAIVNRAIHQLRDKRLDISLDIALPINKVKSDFDEHGNLKYSVTPNGRLSSARGKYLSFLKKLKKYIVNEGVGVEPKCRLVCTIDDPRKMNKDEPLLLSPMLKFRRLEELVDNRIKANDASTADVFAVDCKIPIAQEADSNADKTSGLNSYLAPLFQQWSTDVILGVSQTAYDESQIYLLHRDSLKFEVSSPPTFTAIQPFSNELFTNAQTRVRDIDTANGALSDEVSVDVKNFDIQVETAEFFEWVEEFIDRKLQTTVWNEKKSAEYTKLAEAKKNIVKKEKLKVLSAKQRLDHIFIDQSIDPVKSSKIIEHLSTRTLVNSFLKKLSYSTSVETYFSQLGRIQSPLKGHDIQLFGSVNEPENNSSDNDFYVKSRPSRIKLDGNGEGQLDIEIDVNNPGLREVAKLPNKFDVSHVLYQRRSNGEKIWFSLLTEHYFPLDKSTKDIRVPILYKKFPSPAKVKLTDEQDITFPDSNTSPVKLVEEIRKWSFDFDVSHERAALQDDYEIELIFNHGLGAGNKYRKMNSPRLIGEILYEAKTLRQKFEAISGENETGDVGIQFKILTLWLDDLAKAIDRSNKKSRDEISSVTSSNGKLFLSVRHDPDAANKETIYTLSWDPKDFRNGISFEIIPDATKTTSKRRSSSGKFVLKENGAPERNGTEYLFSKKIQVKNLDLMKEANIFPRIQVHRNRTIDIAKKSNFVRHSFVLRSQSSSLPSVYTPLKHMNVPLNGGDVRVRNQHQTVSSKLKTIMTQLCGDSDFEVANDIRWGFEANQNNLEIGEFHGPDPIAMWTIRGFDKNDFKNILLPSLQDWIALSGKPASGCYEFDVRLYHEQLNSPIIRLEKLRIKLV